MKKFFSYLPVLFLGFGLLLTGCIDDKFDEPPIDGENPNITTNATIADVLALWQPGNIVEITEDLVFSAVVVSSDETGNFYKSLVVEDENSGIRFSINATGLYTDFPQFRRVFVKAKGLYIGDYNELPTIGGGIDDSDPSSVRIERIPKGLISEHIIKGKKNEASPVREKTISEISLSDVNRLVRLTDVEFVADDLNKTMADDGFDANRTLTSCTGQELLMRNSSYSTFWDALIPQKNGTVEAVVSVYGTTIQLSMNRYEDMIMTEDRCTSSGTTGVGVWTYIGTSAVVDSVNEDFNALSSGNDVLLAGWLNATDITNGRFWQSASYQTDYYIQATAYNDNEPNTHSWVITPGVTNIGEKILSFTSSWGFGSLEHVLKVYVSTNFDGTDIGAATWTEINPTVATSSTGEHAWLKSGDFPLSAFSGTGYVAFEYTGAVNNDPSSLKIDNVKINLTGGGGGTTTGGDEVLKEDFEGLTDYAVIDLDGWTNIAQVGGDADRWASKSFSGNGYAEVSGYQKDSPDLEMWLVSPSLDASSPLKLNFDLAMHHWFHDGLTVWVSNDFDGTNVSTANWQEVSCPLPGSSNSNYDWVPSGEILLQDYFSSDNVRVAFKYVGNNSSNTTGYILDNFVVTE